MIRHSRVRQQNFFFPMYSFYVVVLAPELKTGRGIRVCSEISFASTGSIGTGREIGSPLVLKSCHLSFLSQLKALSDCLGLTSVVALDLVHIALLKREAACMYRGRISVRLPWLSAHHKINCCAAIPWKNKVFPYWPTYSPGYSARYFRTRLEFSIVIRN